MSLSSEQDLLHPYLLRDVLEDAIRTMNALLEKYRGDGYEDRYCQGYRDGVAFSKEKVEQMWEEFRGMMWSNTRDNDDYQRAIESYEIEK